MTGQPAGGVLVGVTDPDSAARLNAEGSVLIDLRPAVAFDRSPLQGAVQGSDVHAWRELVTTSGCCWVLLYGGTTAACIRFVLNLPAGVAVLQLREAAARAVTAAGPV